MNRTDEIKVPRADVTKPLTLAFALGRAAYRFFTVSLDRDLRDNATFLYDATKLTGAHPTKRFSRAKWRRASFRMSVVGVPAGLEAVNIVAWPTAQISELVGSTAPSWSTIPWHSGAVGTLAASAAVWGGVGLVHGFRAVQRRESRRLERRVGQSIARLLGPSANADRCVRVSPDWDADPWVEVTLPADWVLGEGAKARLVAQIGVRLGFNNPQGEWLSAAKTPRVTVRPTPAPPETLLWSEVADFARTLPINKVVMGVGTGGPVVADFATDSPHSVISGASGKGKSVLMKMMLAQRMAKGSGVILLDYKNSAVYDYIRDLPSDTARVYVRPEMINEVLVLLKRELEWRIAAREADRYATFRKLDVVIEETNSFAGRMTTWWKETGGKGAEPPCFVARDQLIFMGREYGIHVHYVAQQADATVFGNDQGTSRRINFGLRALAGYEKTTWTMLAYSHDWRPEPEGPVGIWTVLTNTRVDLVRVPFITDDEAMRWSLLGGTGESRPLTHGVTLPLTGESLSMSETTQELLLNGRPAGTVTLSEFASSHGLKRGSLSQAVSRKGLSPVLRREGNQGDLYREEDLVALSSRVV